MAIDRIVPGPGEESVWDYPRPPRVEETLKHIEVIFNGIVIADTRRAHRVLETSHPPVYYIPPGDIAMEHLIATARTSFCEWKGDAVYFTLIVDDRSLPDAAWSYPDPTPRFAAIMDHLAFYPRLMDACYVDGERVTPQPGGFYGGWITSDIVGPFKQ
ncbi:MAG: DUF427 domain-containing protein [Candidatus Kapaibacterium sp.]